MAKKAVKKPAQKTTKSKSSAQAEVAAPVAIKLTKKNIYLMAGAVVILLFSILLWQYLEAKAELRRFQDPAAAIEEEGQSVAEEVSKIMILPAGETPTVANVTDVVQLQDKPFFANAQNGDQVLIYQESQKAILYRPSTKQIVEVASYNSAAEAEPAPVQ